MIWDYENILSRRLFLWAMLNILAGGWMIVLGNAFWMPFGIQAFAWGLVNALIGWYGLQRIKKHLGKPSTHQIEIKEASKLHKLLWINNALDVIYVASGVAIVYILGSQSLFWRGTGWGVILQGSFLFTFDLFHALRIPEPLTLPHLPLFTHPDHEPFLFTGGKPAAVLVHGFPGTALEMRHIGRALNQNGWTVSGLRLPGFGPELDNIIDYNNETWVHTVWEECHTLRVKGHSPILLVGFSFGGALAMQVAAHESLEGLVLIAPITWREPPWGKVIADFIRALMPLSIQPLQFLPIDNPTLVREFEQYLPEIDLNEADHASELRHLKIPLYILDQIREVGREGLAAAPSVHIPTLLIHGGKDKIIQAKWTDHLKEKLDGPVTYKKVIGTHSLTMPHNQAFDEVIAITTNFADQILKNASQPEDPINNI